MKALKFFLITILSLTIFTACEKSADDTLLNEELLNIQDDNDNFNAQFRGPRSIPFKANFYTLRNYEYDGEGACTEAPYVSLNYQVGEGTGTHLGNFDVTLFFCGDNATFKYKNGEGTFVAANGDELYFWVPSPDSIGQVVPYDHPFYEFQFQDPFMFNGGTGRFEGATGGGYTDSYVDLFDDDGNFIPEHQTDHKWTGTLTLP